MNREQTIDYLSDETLRGMSEAEADVTLVNLATGYGMDLNPYMGRLVDLITRVTDRRPRATHLLRTGEHAQTLSGLASESLAFLNDHGIVPPANDHGETDIFAGYGNSTAREDAARRDAVTGREGDDVGGGGAG